MAPSRKKSKAAAAAAARRQWKIGDLVLAKVKGFPAWPATVSEPEKWGYSTDWKKVLVYFFGTKQIAFCNPADVEEFTEEKKHLLLGKRQGRGADFVRAVQEIAACFDKLKENKGVDERSACGAAVENAVNGDLTASNDSAPDATLNSTVKSSNSSRLEDEPGTTLEDVGAVTEVEALKHRGPSQEQENNAVGRTLSLPNTYTLRKKSRSSQPQRSASKKKVSAQRSRSSLHFNPHGLHDGKLKCSDNENSDDVGVNGFSDDSPRKAKKCKQSPELAVPGVGSSPTCNSNGTIEDNGSEIALADSENFSNNEGSVIESGHKRERFDILGGSCDGGLELCRTFDFQATTTVVRKKRNPGRKRAQNDGLESISRSDLEVRNETQALRDTLVLQASCQSFVDTHPKSEGDEHLPLVKRARVRMGKLQAEDNQQLDHGVQTEGKCLESISTNACRLPRTSLNCDDKCSSKNVLAVSELMSPPVDAYNQLADRLQSPKTDICVVNESVLCSPVDNSVQMAGDQPQTWKTKSNLFTFGCVFDGEAALPPSKRLHRALEAMSANAAEENHTLVEIASSTKEAAEETGILSTKSNSDMIVDHEDDSTTDLQKYENGSTDDYSGLSNSSKPSCYEMITKSFQEVSMSDSPDKVLKGEKAYSEEDRTICTENKDPSVSENDREPYNVLPVQASKASNSGNDSGILLDPVLTEPSLDILTKFEEDEEMHESGTGCKNSEDEVHSGGDKNSSVEEEKVIVGCSVGISADLRSEEDRITVVNGILKDSLDKEAGGISNAVDEVNHTETEERTNVASLAPLNALRQQTSHHASDSGDLAKDSDDTTNITSLDVNGVKQMHASVPNSLLPASDNLYRSPHKDNGPMDAKTPHVKHSENAAESGLDISMGQQGKPGERTNLAEVKAALASLELTLGSLTRTKESIGRATRIAVDCVKFGSAAEVVDLLALYLEKESSLYRRVDLFFLVDSIAQCSRGLKGEVGAAYISAVKETLARMLSAAAPPGQAARENRRQCLKVLRLWLERRIFPESIICQHIRELDSLNCSSSTGGYSRRMSRTERSFDDPLRDMEGMMVDEYGSNSSFQLPGFCMPRMLKEDDGSDSDDGSFEAVTPEHDPKHTEPLEANAVVTTEKHRHILEDVDGELEMEDVAPSSEIELDRSTTTGGATTSDAHSCKEQFASFAPPLPHDVPPRAPPLPTSPPPLPPLPPPPPPPPPPLAPHVSTMPHLGVDSQLHGGRNSMQEAIPPRPPASGIHHPMQMPPSTSCSYNSYPAMHNPVAPGNNIQPMDGNLYGKGYNLRPPYPSSSNQFSYLPPDHQGRSQRDVPPPPYYDRSRFAQGAEGGHVYGDHDNIRPPRHEMTDGWGYSRPSFPSHCEPRPQQHGWAYPPHPVHHQNHFPTRPPCDGGVSVAARAPGYWHPR